MSACVAVDARKAVVRVTALDEPLDRAFFYRTLKATRLAQLPAVALRALPQGTRAWIAGAVHTFPLKKCTDASHACLPLP